MVIIIIGHMDSQEEMTGGVRANMKDNTYAMMSRACEQGTHLSVYETKGAISKILKKSKYGLKCSQ